MSDHPPKEQHMKDDPNKRAADALKVNLSESWEVKYWTKKLGCTDEELAAAVKEVGASPANLEARFKPKQSPLA